ncbi:BREX-1 system phosphatase PglZ type B [Gemmatimonas sp.]|uniref:BREX-1 system phosphatase PglZ type B n=1 Tax=Gemmatimonas sp. TaxID=1962908 RepID=UPI00333F3AB8
MTTLMDALAAIVRQCALQFVSGDQVAPRAVLWTDPERFWEPSIALLQPTMPELFVLGPYATSDRRGPGLWLRCVEARVVDGAPPSGTTPVFYLTGVSKEQLRGAEDCPPELTALVELQYRGVMWLHANGKDWTPYAFLVSKHGGLDLDVAKDQATLDALLRALPALMSEPVDALRGKRLDADFFNALVAPDPIGLLLRWLSNQDTFKSTRSEAEWNAFCQQCVADLHFDPASDGPLKAAKLLAARENSWGKVWQRFADVPTNYPGVVDWLNKAAPKQAGVFDSAETWPSVNDAEERDLHRALESLAENAAHDATARILELEARHGVRRGYAWTKLGLSPVANALEPLAQLARLCAAVPGAPSLTAYADHYVAEGWRVDAAALTVIEACGALEHAGAVLGALRAVYLPWLEATSRQLQQLMRDAGAPPMKRLARVEPAPGRLVMFADGLRMDVARRLQDGMLATGLTVESDWEWSTVPSVTSTAKPAASPVSHKAMGVANDGFSTRLQETNQLLTQDRFISTLKTSGWQCLGANDTGDPTNSAWTEAGTLDKRGHNEGWKLARSVDAEVRDLVSRVRSLLRAGWKEIIIVTDHGWLLMPDGLPKVDLKAYLTDDRWGRCASLKEGAQTDSQTFPWHWNASVAIATPPGVGCYRANIEYTHGGVSLQEMVTPVLRVLASQVAGGSPRLADAKWTSARCRITLQADVNGLRVDVRTNPSDPNTSLLTDKQSRETAGGGKVTVFLEDDADIGRQAEIVLLDAAGQVIDTLPTTIGA